MMNHYAILRQKYRDLVQVIINHESDIREKKEFYSKIYTQKNVRKSIDTELKEYVMEISKEKRNMSLSDNYWQDYQFSKIILNVDQNITMQTLLDFQKSSFFYFLGESEDGKSKILITEENERSPRNNETEESEENDENEETDENKENCRDFLECGAASEQEFINQFLNSSYISKLFDNVSESMQKNGFSEKVSPVTQEENQSIRTEHETTGKSTGVDVGNENGAKDGKTSGFDFTASPIEFPEEIVKLAQELSSEITIPDFLNIKDNDMTGADVPKKIFEKLTTQEGQMVFADLMRKTSDKIKAKISAGEFDEEKIKTSAQDCLKSFMEKNTDLQDILKKNFPTDNMDILNSFAGAAGINSTSNDKNRKQNDINNRASNETKLRLQKKLKERDMKKVQ